MADKQNNKPYVVLRKPDMNQLENEVAEYLSIGYTYNTPLFIISSKDTLGNIKTEYCKELYLSHGRGGANVRR
jgi:hypothetical protein